jgi:hypothetical protein
MKERPQVGLKKNHFIGRVFFEFLILYDFSKIRKIIFVRTGFENQLCSNE